MEFKNVHKVTTETMDDRPNPKQEIMLTSYADMILYGGARAGGKTHAAIRWFLYKIPYKEHRGLVIRRNAKDLTDFVDRAFQLWSNFGVKKTGNPAKFTFPSGAIIYTGHLGTEDAYTAYQGHEYDAILIEELTHIPTQLLFEKLMGSLRSIHKHLKPQFLGTTNPGGIGSEWVKEYWHIQDDDTPNGVEFTDNGIVKIYVPATINDNPHLMEADPKYVQFLKNLPADLREKWYHGSWDDIDTDNQYYATLVTRAKEAGRITKVPFESGLRTFTAFDLGIKDAMVLWTYQIFGKEIRVVDCHVGRNLPLKAYADYLRKQEKKYLVEIETVIVPHDANVRSMVSDTLQTRAQKLEELGFDVQVLGSKVSVDDGIDAVRDLLAYCYIDDVRCKEGIRALRSYQKEFDEKMNRYKDKPLHDWASDFADSFRYLALSLQYTMTGGNSNVVNMQRELFTRRRR